MTAIEAVEEIIKTPKYYTHLKPPMAQSTASTIIIAIKNGTCKSDTESSFLAKFGYGVASERQYKKS